MIDELMTKMAHDTVEMPTESPYEMESGEEYPQHFELTSEQLPAIKSWKPGETYTMLIKAKQKDLRAKDEGEMCASFVISEITPIEASKDMSSYFTE
jgi:hypothetical protein